MLSWSERPFEIANLFNPAFCGLLLHDAIKAYSVRGSRDMPYLLTVVILPLVLHEATREKLPRTTATKFHSWIQTNPEILIGFADRIRRIDPYTREALVFGISHGAICLTDQGELSVAQLSGRGVFKSDSKVMEYRRSAEFIGRWLADVGHLPTLFTWFGIRP